MLVSAVSSEAQTLSTAAEFTVKFDGIIMHYFPASPLFTNARALIIQGNAMTLRHNPTLITPVDIDVAALRDATGQPVFCDNLHCRVKISGFDMQIGTADLKPAPDPLTVDLTFNDAPNMQRVTRGEIISSVADGLPAPPIAGFFELSGGALTASRFKVYASFKPDHDNEGSRPFAHVVSLHGFVAPNSVACLQIRSIHTWPDWEVVCHEKPEPLTITVENQGTHSSNGQPVPSTLHFALNKKVIVTALPFPHVCPSDGSGDDPACSSTTPLSQTKSMFDAIAGCANTQWP